MKKAVLILIVVVLVGGGVYVATKDNKTTKSPTTSSSQPMNMNNKSPATTNTQTQATNAVTIENFAFSPATMTVKKGTTVTWTNKDSTGHDVVETDGKTGPKSKLLNSGESYSFTFDTAGTYAYQCSVHPNMTAKVTVTE